MMAAAMMENIHGDTIQGVGRGGERVKEKGREGRGKLGDKRRGVKRRRRKGHSRRYRGCDEAVNEGEEVKRGETYK